MLVLKLGGSVITKKDGYKEINYEKVEEIISIIAKHWNHLKGKLFLVNGAGSFGHALVKAYNIENGVFTDKHKLGMADTYNSCNGLSNHISKKLIEKGVPSIFVPPIAFAKRNGENYQISYDLINELLKEGYLPISGGNMVLDETRGASPISGDRIIYEYVKKYKATVAFGTDVPGVLDNKGQVIKKITKENFPEIKEFLYTKEGDVTGAMLRKIEKILNIPKGIKIYIFNLNNLEQLDEFLEKGKIEKGEFTLIET